MKSSYFPLKVGALILSVFSPNLSFATQVIPFAKMALLSQATTAQGVFDEAINLAPNFGASQLDPGLSQDFAPGTNSSELCVPTSLAHFIAYQMGITYKIPISTKVPGVSVDLSSLDLNPLIQDLVVKCNTSLTEGTSRNSFLNCIQSAPVAYGGTAPTSIDLIESSSASVPGFVNFQNRWPTLADIRSAIRQGLPVLVRVGWYNYNPTASSPWSEKPIGHEFVVYGYNSLNTWAGQQMELINMNPNFTWLDPNPSGADFNLSEAFTKSQPLFDGATLFLDGPGFYGTTFRAFITRLVIPHF